MKRNMTVCLGEDAVEVGSLAFEAKGTRRSASFVYADSWLANSDRFSLSPDLPLVTGYQFRANNKFNGTNSMGSDSIDFQ